MQTDRGKLGWLRGERGVAGDGGKYGLAGKLEIGADGRGRVWVGARREEGGARKYELVGK